MGRLDYTLSRRRTQAHVGMIYVHSDHRRQGYATALMDEMRRHYPQVAEVDLGYLLPDGEKFFQAM